MRTADRRFPTLCQGCGRKGLKTLGSKTKPRWCRCTGRTYGPVIAAPGTIVRFVFEDRAAAAFRERCRILSNAERTAVEELRSGRWVRCGRGYRRLPDTSKKVMQLEAACDAALAALEAAQAECSHPERCPYWNEACGVCRMHVESDVEHHRHLVREGILEAS